MALNERIKRTNNNHYRTFGIIAESHSPGMSWNIVKLNNRFSEAGWQYC